MSTTSYVGTMSNTAVSYAKDYVSGFDGDYLFFQDSQNVYYLVLADHIIEDSGYMITEGGHTVVRLTYDPFDYSQPADLPSHWLSHVVQSDIEFSFQPFTDQFYYCSAGIHPRLQDGSVKYAYFTNLLLLCGFCFMLAARIFKRLF